MLPPVARIILGDVLKSSVDKSAQANPNKPASLGQQMQDTGTSIPQNGIVGRYVNSSKSAPSEPQNDNQRVRQEIQRVKTSHEGLTSVMARAVAILGSIQDTLRSQLSLQRYQYNQDQRQLREQKLEKVGGVLATGGAGSQNSNSDGKGMGLVGTLAGIAGLLGLGGFAAYKGLEAAMPGVMRDIDRRSRNTANAIGDAIDDIASKAGVTTPRRAGAKSRQLRERQIYKLLREQGMSHEAAIGFMGEIGRENSFSDRYLFGSHIDDANHEVNIGMFSWQGSRGQALRKDLERQGLLKNGQMEHSEQALKAMIAFAMKEGLTGSAGGTKAQKERYRALFQKMQRGEKPTNSEMRDVLGGDFVRWAINNPEYRDSGLRNREYYMKESEYNVANLKDNPRAMQAPPPPVKSARVSVDGDRVVPGFAPGSRAERQADALVSTIKDRITKNLADAQKMPDLRMAIYKASGNKLDIAKLHPSLEWQEQDKKRREQSEIKWNAQRTHILTSVSGFIKHANDWLNRHSRDSQRDEVAKARTWQRIRQANNQLGKSIEPLLKNKKLADGTIITYDARTGKVVKASSPNPRLEALHKNDSVLVNTKHQAVIHNNTTNVARPAPAASGGSPRLLPSPSHPKIDLYHLYFEVPIK